MFSSLTKTRLNELAPGSLARQTHHSSLIPRSTDPHGLCVDLDAGKNVISRTTLIVAVTVCAIVTCASLLGIMVLLYHEWMRRRQTKAARAWGRSSRFEKRVSSMRKEVDNEYSRQYSGCLYQEPENPYLEGSSPVELMQEVRLCEAAATEKGAKGKGDAKAKRATLLFDHGIGMWRPKT